MKFKHLVGLSLLIHVAFVLSFSLEIPRKSEEVKSRQTAVKFLVEPTKTKPSDLKSDSYYKTDEPEDQICEGKDRTFVGVGMIIQPGTGRVISAPERFPAFKAGVRLDDVILDPYGPSVENGRISFEVKTGSVSRLVSIKPERICYK